MFSFLFGGAVRTFKISAAFRFVIEFPSDDLLYGEYVF